MALRSADETLPYYVATEALPPGAVVSEENTRVAYVQVDHDIYWEAGPEAPWGSVVTRTVGAGELLPVGALAEDASVHVRSVGIRVSTAVAEDIDRGTVVDVWLTTPATNEQETSTVLVGEQLVVADVERDSGLGASGHVTVHVVVPDADVAAFLQATSGDGVLTVVGLGDV